MKKLNKYYWLGIVTACVFCLMYLANCKREKRIVEYETSYPLKVVDNEIRYGDQVLYRFIPVDGGYMDFTYKSKRTQRDAVDNIDDTVDVYNSVRAEIPSFLIGETPVTINLWAFVMEKKIAPEGSAYLYETVYVGDKTKEEWEEFISKLCSLTGFNFSLPTSNQWEYAARGGLKSKNFKYSGSNDINEVANYKGNTRSKRLWLGKEKAPNELGLYDMSGSVLELTSTPYSETDSWVKMLANSPDAPADLINGNISRGGDITSEAEECETRYRKSGVTIRTGARLILNY